MHHLFMVFLFLSDPGTMAYDIDSSIWYKVSAVIAGMAGVVIFSALIAFITTALDQKINELKKGHAKTGGKSQQPTSNCFQLWTQFDQ